MNCVKCSTKLPSGKLFCPACGTMNKEQAREVVAEVKNEKISNTASNENYYESKKIDISVLKEFFFKSRIGKLILVVILSIILLPLGIYGYRKYQQNKWSDYVGDMNWTDANEKCESIGMRLPSIDELKEAYGSEITESWKKKSIGYWSSTPCDAERYYSLDVYNGYIYGNRDHDGVRCHR